MPRAYNYEARVKAWQLKTIGLSIREIARELGVVPGTAQRYLAEPPKPPAVRTSTRANAIYALGDSGSIPDAQIALGQVKVRTGAPLWEVVLLDPVASPTDLYAGAEPSRWDDPGSCLCVVSKLRRYSKSERTHLYTLHPDDPNNDLQPHIRCPVHNSKVRSIYVDRVGRDNGGQLFCNTFFSRRHADSAAKYAGRKNISVVKSRFQLPHYGNVWTTVARENITERTGTRSSLVVEEPTVVLPELDKLLTKIDPMRTTFGRHGWERPPKKRAECDQERQAGELFDEISIGLSESTHDLFYEVIGKFLEDQIGDPMAQSDWDRLKRAFHRRK